MNWPQGNGDKVTPELKVVLQTVEMLLIKPLHDQFPELLCTSPLPHTPLKLPFKSSCPFIGSEELILWNVSPPSPQDCQLPY